MNWIAIRLWIRAHDPDGRTTELQHLNIESALMRDDVKTAKKYLDDYLKARR